MESKNPALDFLRTLINIYKRKEKEYFEIIDISYSALLSYLDTREFLLHLKNLYYKLTNKEYKD